MKTLHTVLITSVYLSVISAVAVAGPGPYGQSKFMMFFDSNNDKVVTLDELNAASKTRFEKMDTDGNGIVTLEEFKAYVGARKNEHRQQRFESMDTNSDGQVSRDEFIAHKQQRAEQHFLDMDTNSDGLLSNEEYAARKRGHHGKHGKHYRKPGHHGGGGLFSRLDKNDDGQITLEESINAWTEWFNRIDANSDQVVTAEEVQEFRKNMRGNW